MSFPWPTSRTSIIFTILLLHVILVRCFIPKKYNLEILERESMTNCKLTWTLGDTLGKLGDTGQPIPYLTFYKSPLGALQHLNFSRYHVCCVNILLIYAWPPHREPNFMALKRIICYICGTISHGLHLYASFSSMVIGPSNADWVGWPKTCHSRSDYCVFLEQNLLSKFSKHHDTICWCQIQITERN